MLWALLACRPATIVDSEALGLRLVWADLHAHTNLSMDGCEANGEGCVSREPGMPAADVLDTALQNGLSVLALTDHAEFSTYTDLSTGVGHEIWPRTLEIIQSAPDGLVVFPGYEWTAHCVDAQGIHRTVVFESPGACEELRVPSCQLVGQKDELGLEVYGENPNEPAGNTDKLYSRLAEVEACSTRWLSFVHHSAMTTPASVDWGHAAGPEDEVLLEVHSEHGSSECRDPLSEGCAWGLSEFHDGSGSLQAALAAGQRPGLLAGTDSHDARPGSLSDGPGPSGLYVDMDSDGLLETALPHPFAGGVTGIWVESLEREEVFDALLDKRTIAASWPMEITALAGEELPGRALEIGQWPLTVSVSGVDDWTWELVSASGTVEEEPESMTLASTDVFYLRIRASVDGVEQRAWASPWWAE
ncbi:MAG TPA: hypothetical protein QGF58_08260 [Myxococcota bacterium]|nr:hypothetical protein [Myxococcota bacterium]